MDLSSNLDHFRIFYMVAREGNITKAAEKLYISQPAVSMTIKNLEENLGNKLFIRSKRGVTLTKFGEKIFNKVDSAFLQLSQIGGIVEEEDQLLRGEIVIGCGSHIARQTLVEPLKKFLNFHPQIKIKQIEDVQAKMFSQLEKGEIDLIISQYNEIKNELVFKPLHNQPYAFVRSPNAETTRFISFSQGSYAQKIFSQFIKDYHYDDVPNIQVSGYNFAIELALNGLGTTLAPAYLTEKYVKAGTLELVYSDYPLPNINFGFYYNPKLLSRAAKELIKNF